MMAADIDAIVSVEESHDFETVGKIARRRRFIKARRRDIALGVWVGFV